MFEFLNSEMGSAKDNNNTPIHNWYKFTAGFSHLFVDGLLKSEIADSGVNPVVFDPFAGCGTTLVSSQKKGVYAIGNESQEFMYDVIRAKLNWNISKSSFDKYLKLIFDSLEANKDNKSILNMQHPLLKSLYKTETLSTLYLLKHAISLIPNSKYKLFFQLALSQTLHKVSIHPIAVPYISRSRTLATDPDPKDYFEKTSRKMLDDTNAYSHQKKTASIYLHDSRKPNTKITDGECSVCITSPPYLNNLDYGEVSKVHTHFYNITADWNDITESVRRKLVTGSTTHYSESKFSIKDFELTEFACLNPQVMSDLKTITQNIHEVSKERAGKKSFDILAMLYFHDMYLVLKEIRRVLKQDRKAYLVLGDSAPYGVYVPTADLLGRISKSVGFNTYRIDNIRARGTKWKTLKYRHSLDLSESILTLS